MPVGSAYATVKAAIAEALAARPGLNDVTVLPHPPVKPEELKGIRGSGKAIWFADAEGAYDNVVFLAPYLFLDETFQMTCVLQSLPGDSSDTQLVTDMRVDEMLYEVLQEFAAQEMSDLPAWGIETIPAVRVTRGAFKRFCGPYTNTVMFPSRCEFAIEVEARIQLPGI